MVCNQLLGNPNLIWHSHCQSLSKDDPPYDGGSVSQCDNSIGTTSTVLL